MDELQGQILIPDDVDTSTPLYFTIRWFSTATSGNVEWDLYTSVDEEGSVFKTSSPGELSQTLQHVVTTVSGTAGTVNTSTFAIDIQLAIPGESTLNFNLRRDARLSNTEDTMSGPAILKEIDVLTTMWKLGRRVVT